MINITDLNYRKGVGIVLINDKKDIFIAKRIDSKGNNWQMPQGGIDEKESVEQAALRELYEETNILKVSIISKTKNWQYYTFPKKVNNTFYEKDALKKRYFGQKQIWFLMKSLDSSFSEVNLSKSKFPEFEDWQWSGKEYILSNVIYFKKSLYKKIFQEFRGYI